MMTQSPRRSCPHLFLNGQLQQPDWSCCSSSNAHCYTQSHLLEHWWHYQQVAVVHGLICMDKPDTPIDLIIQRLRWSCVSKSLQQPDWCSCPYLVLNGRLQQADWSCCSENTAHWTTDDIINKWHLSIAWMEKPDTSISPTVQGLKWSCMSKSLQDWWPSQQVAVVLMLFWMDSCNNLIGSVVQRVTLTETLMTLQWQLSIAWFAWTSQTPQMVQVASAGIHTAATVSVLQLDKFAVQMKQVFPGRQHCLQQLHADYCQPPQQVHVDCTLTLSGCCVYQPKLSTLFEFAASWLMHLTWMTSRFCTESAAQLHKNELAMNKRKQFLLVRWCKHVRSHLTYKERARSRSSRFWRRWQMKLAGTWNLRAIQKRIVNRLSKRGRDSVHHSCN